MKIVTLIPRLIVYFFIFMYELLKANIIDAMIVLSPRMNFKSAAVKLKSDMKTRTELVLITNSITLTPGTLVMDANLTTGEILVHVLAGHSTEEIKKSLAAFPEKKALWALRGT